MINNIQPVYPYLLVTPVVEEKKTSTGIILAGKNQSKDMVKFKVLQINHDSAYVVDDRLYLKEDAEMNVVDADNKLYLINEDDVIAVIVDVDTAEE